MKKSIFLFFLLLSLNSFSQISRGDIEIMIKEVGTSLDKIEELFVGNGMEYYKDGTSKQTYEKYKAEKGNVFELTENGIKAIYKPEGVVKSVFFVPYSSIVTIDVGANYISIYLIK